MVHASDPLPERLRLPLLCSTPGTARAVRGLLAARPGLRVDVHEALGPWAEQAVAVGVGLLDVAALERDGDEDPSRGLWSEQAVRPQIVALASDPRAAADFGEIAETEWVSLVLSIEGREFGYAVARALIIATGRRLRALVDEARHVPYEVRSVLRHLTGRVLSGPGSEDHPPPPHQIADLARETAVSRAHLYRRLDACPVDLRALAETWLAM